MEQQIDGLMFWSFALAAAAFFFGFLVGAIFVIVREEKRKMEDAKWELRKVCGHGNSTFEDSHPDFPWRCCTCDALHDGEGTACP